MTNYDKYDMFITVAKAFGNEVSESRREMSNKTALKPASFNDITAMLGSF